MNVTLFLLSLVKGLERVIGEVDRPVDRQQRVHKVGGTPDSTHRERAGVTFTRLEILCLWADDERTLCYRYK